MAISVATEVAKTEEERVSELRTRVARALFSPPTGEKGDALVNAARSCGGTAAYHPFDAAISLQTRLVWGRISPDQLVVAFS